MSRMPNKRWKMAQIDILITNERVFRMSGLIIIIIIIIIKKALTLLRGPLAYPNGLLDLHIETFW